MISGAIRGVLLDVDGTLVDSNLSHARAWREAMVEAGLDPPPVELVRRLIGMGGDKLLPAAVGVEEDTPLGQRVSERRGEMFRERYLLELRPTPGAASLVAALESRGLRIGIATSAKPEELRGLLAQAGVSLDLADRAASSGDVESSKPDPDVVHAALARMGLAPESVVLVGDSPYDIEAGRRAGIGVIALRCGGWSDEDLRGALAVYDDPADLVAHLDESAIAR